MHLCKYIAEAGESFFGNLIKSLAPLGAPLAPAANPNIGLPPAHGVGVGVGASGIPPSNTIGRGGCPLCDSSVYSYCSAKMVHDACCCSGGENLYISSATNFTAFFFLITRFHFRCWPSIQLSSNGLFIFECKLLSRARINFHVLLQ